jgi:TolA-binding protein
MNTNHRSTCRLLTAIVIAGSVLLPAVSAVADSIFFKTGGGAATEFETKGITVVTIENNDGVESIKYLTENGSPRYKPIDTIVRIALDNEPAFTQAESDFAKGNLGPAAENYRKAMATTSKAWIKHRADVRLLGISSKTGDFVGAVAGYVDLVRKDPTTGADHKPAIAGAKPDQLTAAIAAVNRGIADAKMPAKEVLYPYLAELLNAKGDAAGATAALDALNKLGPPANSTGAGQPVGNANVSAKEATADVTLTEATKAFADKKYADCIAKIMAAKGSFIDPEKQARALYLVAEAKAATATTPDALSEAALAYMRVVANFKSQPSAPIPDALYKTAAIEEKLGKPSEAILIYKQLSSEYKDSKAATDAQAAIARIQASN